jgi:hypothetical protein
VVSPCPIYFLLCLFFSAYSARACVAALHVFARSHLSFTCISRNSPVNIPEAVKMACKRYPLQQHVQLFFFSNCDCG